eukprot:6308462-Pyramimonas_sp.AAC.1
MLEGKALLDNGGRAEGAMWSHVYNIAGPLLQPNHQDPLVSRVSCSDKNPQVRNHYPAACRYSYNMMVPKGTFLVSYQREEIVYTARVRFWQLILHSDVR